MAGKIVVILAGLFLVAVTLRDVFQSVIVPRAEHTRLRASRYLIRSLWHVWPAIADAFYSGREEKREDFLATYAPFTLIAMFVMWLVLLVIAWGLFFYGVRDQLHPANLSFGDAAYYAGASLLTIGYGDIVAVGMFARIMSLFAAASGLGVVAVVISFLFAIFGSFQARERFIVTIGARSGLPPSGVGLLTVQGGENLRTDLPTVFREGQAWTAQVMESQLAYPILMYFRSSHDYESWVGTLGTLLDATVLVLSTIEPAHPHDEELCGQAQIMYDLGRHLTTDFSHYFKFPHAASGPGVEREEYDDACRRLREAGYELLPDTDASWNAFVRLRSTYAPQLNEMARWLQIPPLQWISDRAIIARHESHVIT